MSDIWTWHGGALDAAKRHFGTGVEPWIDLSTGINPHPWPVPDDLAIDWQRLPEPELLQQLEAAASVYFGVAAEHVCAVPGTEIGLRLAGRLIGGSAHHVAPSYRTHGEMIAGSTATEWDGDAQSGQTLILANPNNPDGRLLKPEQLSELLRTRADGQWLLLDEAFADSDPAISMTPMVSETELLLIFRSFGKFFGLAGVRLGFVLGPPSILAALRAQLGAWPLSTAAIAIGTAAYRDRDWIAATRRRLHDDAARLDLMLERSGYRPIGHCPLFRLIETEEAQSLFDRLTRASILTRPFADQPHWLRFGLPPDQAAQARLERALGHG
ncbi:threonine-phosphate decarboxylase CobD [Sphingobium sp. BYY-5]|uniref:threonine-phosphate decarboxylase CobD n=1 Tax=Sphingobium sp. BYY-5 TaxID=2926400 RepID=UPI001FA7ED0E|nr:threonine-phosphate decarboxylase CobD [Sphingobium sp. BYY-5]MCI4589357.1 threonine-phosphate decarboxylase CobD [Sphingobium sp. BYY-5]